MTGNVDDPAGGGCAGRCATRRDVCSLAARGVRARDPSRRLCRAGRDPARTRPGRRLEGRRKTGRRAALRRPSPRAMQKSGANLSVPTGGYEMEVETAFMFREGRSRRPAYSDADVLEAIAGASGDRALGSRFVDRRALPPLHPSPICRATPPSCSGRRCRTGGRKTSPRSTVRLLIDGRRSPGRPSASLADNRRVPCLARGARCRGVAVRFSREPSSSPARASGRAAGQRPAARRRVRGVRRRRRPSSPLDLERNETSHERLSGPSASPHRSRQMVERFRELPVANVSDVMSPHDGGRLAHSADA